MLIRRFISIAALFLFTSGLMVSNFTTTAFAKERKLVLHVDDNNPKKMKLALNIIEATKKEWEKRGDTVLIEVVAHGAGLHMLRSDTSPVKKGIAVLTTKFDGLKFSACGNTVRKQSSKEGKAVPLIDEAELVPAGVVRIMELQDLGYNYVRP